MTSIVNVATLANPPGGLKASDVFLIMRPGIPALYSALASQTYLAGYVFSQPTPSSIWTITHNLARYPNVTVVDTSQDEVWGDKLYQSINTIVLNFSAPLAGTAYLN